MKKIISFALIFSTLVQTTAFAASCVSDASKFEFMSTSGQVFHFGKEEEVRSIYGKLKEHIVRPEIYGQTTLFYAQGRLKRLFTSICAEDKCTGMDILRGLQNCSSESPSPSTDNICHPLAAVYHGKVYCLLAPALDTYSSTKPFTAFNPYEEDIE